MINIMLGKKMWTMVKYVLLIIAFVFIIAGMYFTYEKVQNYIIQDRIRLLNNMKLITENIVAVNIIENNKVLKQEIAKLDSDIKKYVKSTNSQITNVGNVVAELKQTVRLNQSSDHTYIRGNENDHEFIDIKNAKDVPIAWSMFYPNKTENKWKSGTYQQDYYTNIVIAENKEGKEEVIAKTYMTVDKAGYRDKQVPVDVKSVNWVKEKTKERSFAFNPTLSLGINSNIDDIYPILDIGFFSYGKTYKDFDFRFLNVGVGYNDDLYFGVSPVQYNLGNYLPLISNLLVGPTVYSDSYLNVKFGIQISGLF